MSRRADEGESSNAGPLELAMLLRVPPPLAEQLHKQMADKTTGNVTVNVKEDKASQLRLTFTTDSGEISLQQPHREMHTGQIVNLPAIVEVQKTFDHIHYYKVADIGQVCVYLAARLMLFACTCKQTCCFVVFGFRSFIFSRCVLFICTVLQMLVVQAPVSATSSTPSLTSNPVRPKPGAGGAADPNASQANQPIPVDWPHGLTPPTRDIRAKRYERNTTVPQRIVQEVETLLQNLHNEKDVHTFELVEDDDVEIIDSEGDDEDEDMEDDVSDTQEADGMMHSSDRLGSASGDGWAGGRLDSSTGVGSAGATRSGTAAMLASPSVLRGSPHTGTSGGGSRPATGSRSMLRSPGTAGAGGSSERMMTSARTDTGIQEPGRNNANPAMFASPMRVQTTDNDVRMEPAPATAAGASSSVPKVPISSTTINVDSLEHMFGPPSSVTGMGGGTRTAMGGGTVAATMVVPEVAIPMDLFAAPSAPLPSSSIATAAASAAAAGGSELSPAQQVQLQLDELTPRVEKARQALADAKNALLKNRAQKALDDLLAQLAALQAKLASS